MIIIVAAMEEELNFFHHYFTFIKKIKHYNTYDYCYKYNNHDILVIKSGIGKVAASSRVAMAISKYNPDLLINTGTAGGYKKKLKMYDLIVANKLSYSDVDVQAFNYEYGQLPNQPLFFKPTYKYLRIAKTCMANNHYLGTILSGDQFVTDKKKIQKIIEQKFKKDNVLALDMESTAIAQVCHTYKTPYLIFRTISDVIDFEGTKDEFAYIACKSSEINGKFILEFLNKYE